MSKETQLAKNTIIITFSKICTQLINFLLLPVYTTLLSTEDFGIVDLLNTYISVLIPIITLQLENAIFRFLIDVRGDHEEKKEYITTVLLIVSIQVIIYLILFSLISKFVRNDYKYFLASNLVAFVFSSVMLQIARGLGDNKSYAIGSAKIGISNVILNIIFVAGFRLGATGMLTASFISNIICCFYILFKKKIYCYVNFNSFNKNKSKFLLRYSIPLIPNALSWWVINASDRSIITAFLGVSANGIYAAANKFSGVFITFYNIFNMTWTESAVMHINDRERDVFFSNIINTMFKFYSSICFGIIALMPFVFYLLINEKFSEAYFHIPILLLGSLFNIVVGLYSVIYIAKKQTRKVANTSLMAAFTNITVNLILVKRIGLYAASISTVVAFFVLMIFRYFDVQKYANVRLSKKLIASTILMLIILFTTYYMQNLIGHITALAITIIYSIIGNGKMIKVITRLIKSKFSKTSYN